MHPLTESIVETADFAASQTKSIDINLKGYITQVDVDITLNVTAASSVTPNSDDEALRIIKGLKLTASNAKDFFSFRDGREAYWLCYLKSEGQAIADSLPTSGTSDVTIQFSLHPGNFWSKPYDLTRCIPLRGLSNVQMQVTWGSDSDLGTGYTVNASDSSMAITVHRQVLDKGEREDEAFGGVDHIIVPRYVPVVYSIDGVYQSFGFSKNIQTGSRYRDVMLMVLSSSDVRSNSDVTAVQVSNNLGKTPFKQLSFARWLRQLRQRLRLPAALTGVGIIFFPDITSKDYGLDMVSASLGDWKLDFTTAAADGEIHALYEGADLVSVDATEIGTSD